jgi:hypothetical protein
MLDRQRPVAALGGAGLLRTNRISARAQKQTPTLAEAKLG